MKQNKNPPIGRARRSSFATPGSSTINACVLPSKCPGSSFVPYWGAPDWWGGVSFFYTNPCITVFLQGGARVLTLIRGRLHVEREVGKWGSGEVGKWGSGPKLLSADFFFRIDIDCYNIIIYYFKINFNKTGFLTSYILL